MLKILVPGSAEASLRKEDNGSFLAHLEQYLKSMEQHEKAGRKRGSEDTRQARSQVRTDLKQPMRAEGGQVVDNQRAWTADSQ